MLSLAEDLDLPVEAVTETFAILAMRRVGKSNAAVVMAEEMHAAGLPFVVIDPKGDWWGLKADGDGSPGLPIVIFGGDHGDLPLEASAGKYLAQLIAEQRLSCVLDVSTMDRQDQITFLLDFATELLKVNRDPLHVICEEADDYIPQDKFANELRLVRAFSKLVRHGGFRGIGCTIITQRPALVSKNVLSQINTLIVLRITHAADQDTVKAWAKGHPLLDEILGSLRALPVGKGWVISPGFLDTTRAVRFRRRRTFDSGTTPRVGEARRTPTAWADVDLAGIRTTMADAIERAEADDPTFLHRRIATLEAELAHAHAASPEPIIERVEVPILDPSMADDLADVLDPFLAQTNRVLDALKAAAAQPSTNGWHAQTERHTAALPERQPVDLTPVTMTAGPGRADLAKVDRAILTVLAQHPGGRTRQQIAILSGYSPTSGSFDQGLARCRAAGYMTRDRLATITTEGEAALGDYDLLPIGDALLTWWLGKLSKAEGAALLEFVKAYATETLDKATLAERTGYSATSGSFDQALGKLRTLRLVDGWRAAPDFMRAIGRVLGPNPRHT